MDRFHVSGANASFSDFLFFYYHLLLTTAVTSLAITPDPIEVLDSGPWSISHIKALNYPAKYLKTSNIFSS